METRKEAAAADLASATFSQVVFTDTQYSYPPSAPITCRFTLNAAFQPSSRDWVGIFKVGWTSTKDYRTFVWVETIQDAEGQQTKRQAVFKEYYLPKDEVEFYQFCYIDSSGQVRGASTPFRFTNPAEQNTESSLEDDLLVITTQDQVEQSQREKEELQKELDQLRAENENLRSALQEEQKESLSLQRQNEERETERTKMVKELDQIKEHNEKFKHTLQLQLKENDRLKEEMVIQLTRQMETEQQSQNLVSSKTNEEKYDRAVMKINQLKEEREELRMKLEAQSDEIPKLKAKLRETERELSSTNDRFQLLQVDLQSSVKEKERVAAELQRLQSFTGGMDEVKRENRELSRRLSEQEATQRLPQDDLKVQCQNLSRQLQETQNKLAAEREEARTARRQAEAFENELTDIKEQLRNVATACSQENRQRSKYELLVTEMNKHLADKDIVMEEKEQQIVLVKRENQELIKENQKLKDDIERLRTLYTRLDKSVGATAAAAAAAASAESLYMQPDIVAPVTDTSGNQQSSQGQQEHIYDTIESLQIPEEEPPLVCRHCQERFPGITGDELEQHEQSHRVCPFCTMICDNMEQSVFEDHVYGHEL